VAQNARQHKGGGATLRQGGAVMLAATPQIIGDVQVFCVCCIAALIFAVPKSGLRTPAQAPC
jgi:uncharacterized membrane protein